MSTYIKTGFWEKIKQAPKEWLNLDNLIIKLISENTPVIVDPYKSYDFGLKGNTFYFPTVFRNTINDDIVYSKVSPGIFTLTSPSNSFTANKTMVIPLSGYFVPFVDEGLNKLLLTITYSTSQINITFYNDIDGLPGTVVDPVIPNYGITLEIRVYP